MEAFSSDMMNIETHFKESMFDGMVAVEKIDEDKLNKLLNSNLLLEDYKNFYNKEETNEKIMLMKYRDITIDGYAYSLHTKKNIGRSKADKGSALLQIRRQIRQTICYPNEIYDIDMDACHPNIMFQMLRHENIECKCLEDYVKRTDFYRTLIIDTWNIKSYFNIEDYKSEEEYKKAIKEKAKQLMLRIMYGGSILCWETDNKFETKMQPQLIKDFYYEFKRISKIFGERNPHIVEEVKKEKDKNIIGSVTSRVMQQKESEILEVVTKYMIKRNYIEVLKPGYIKFGPCADGLIVDKSRVKNIDFLLNELTMEVFYKTGFFLKFSTKPMTEHFLEKLEDKNNYILNNKYGPNYRKVNNIKNADDMLYEEFRNCKFFSNELKRVNYNATKIFLEGSNYNCPLCKATHKIVRQEISYNDKNKLCIKCHKESRVIKNDTAKEEAKLLHIEQGQMHINDFYNSTDNEDIKIINENSKYISCNEDNKFVWRKDYNNAFIILSKSMGGGKTQFIKKFLKKMNINSILIISQRKSFTHFIVEELKEFNITSYLDIKNNDYRNHDNICIQIESLWKIKDMEFDIVIIDECETVLNQFSSSTMTHVRVNFEMLTRYMAHAKHTILADAFITQRTKNYVRMMRDKRNGENNNIVLINNTKLFLENRQAIQLHGKDFTDNIIEALKSNKKIAIISTSKSELEVIEKSIKTNKDTKDLNIKYYDCFSKKDNLRDVNENWKDANAIMYTPVITTGLSYTNQDVDTVFVNCENTCQSRDMMQMILRIRHLKDNKIYFALPNKNIPRNSEFINATFKDFNRSIKNKGKEMIKAISDQDLKDKIRNCIDESDNEDLMKIMFYNIREQSISSLYFSQLTLYLLEKQGYILNLLDEKNEDLKKDKEELDYTALYEEIDEYDMKKVQQFENVDTDKPTKLAIDRFYFENMLIKDLPSNIKGKLFFDYYENSFKKQILQNLRVEKSNQSMDDMIDNDLHKSDNLINKMSTRCLRLNHIRNLNKILDLEKSCENGKVIKRNDKINEYILKNINSINIAFSTKYNVPYNKTQSNLIVFKALQKIYNNWSGLSFKSHKKGKTGTTEYITEANDIIDYIKEIREKNTYEN